MMNFRLSIQTLAWAILALMLATASYGQTARPSNQTSPHGANRQDVLGALASLLTWVLGSPFLPNMFSVSSRLFHFRSR
jgi:Co/Zn/Cd efflux system component